MKATTLNKMLFLFLALGMIFTACKKDEDILTSQIPAIMGVSPSEGTVGTELAITGANFRQGASVFIGNEQSIIVEVVHDTLLYAIVPSGIPVNTLLSVKVKNNPGGEATLSNAFKAIVPELSLVNSATKPSGNPGSTVILEGYAFGDIQGVGKVLFSDGSETGTIAATIASPEDWTDTFIVTTVPTGVADGPIVVETETGTSNSLPFTVTSNAAFSPSTINWTLTTPLPLAVSGHQVIRVPIDDASLETQQYIYVSGGRTAEGTPSDQLIYSIINIDASVDFWQSAVTLPQPLAFHASVAATPFNSRIEGDGTLYILGGINTEGEVVNTVATGKLGKDGSLQSGWSFTTPLPKPLYSAGAVVFRGVIYVAGGSTSAGAPVTSVYRALINEDGQLGDWQTLPELPSARTHHSLVSFGGYLYCVGGETEAVDPDSGTLGNATDQVLYARINLRNGLTDSWVVNPSALQKNRSKHTTLVLGGSMFVSSGLYSGLSPSVQGSSENMYASINADGTIGSFGGATGSNTLFSTGGNNLFNQGGISYIDADGVAHVMILGGAKVGAPSTKLDKVMFY